MKKKPWIVVLFALLVIAAVSFTLSSGSAKDAVPQAGNLIANGDFSILEDGQPKGWETGMWVTSAGASYLEAVTLADGTTAALVENAASNDARFEQAVAVRENTTYKLTARVMAEGCGEGTKGANVSFSGIYGTSRDLHDTDGQWETLTLYGRTGKGQKEVTVMVRLRTRARRGSPMCALSRLKPCLSARRCSIWPRPRRAKRPTRANPKRPGT